VTNYMPVIRALSRCPWPGMHQLAARHSAVMPATCNASIMVTHCACSQDTSRDSTRRPKRSKRRAASSFIIPFHNDRL